MQSDDFLGLARVLGRSRIARAGAGVGVVLRAATANSAAAGVVRAIGHTLRDLPPVERVQLTGVLLLTAAVTHGLVLQLVPALVRPAAPRLLRIEVIALASVLIAAAPSLVRAWPSSRLGRLVSHDFLLRRSTRNVEVPSGS